MYPDLQGLAAVLGLGARGRKLSEMALAAEIEQGLPIASLDNLVRAMTPDNNNLLAYRVVPRSTYTRRVDRGFLTPDESNRVARMADVWMAAKDVWQVDKDARDFLFREHPMLGGKQPFDVAFGSDIGARLVKDILGRLKYGSAA